MSRCLIVMAKQPTRGQVKTRLAATIGETAAAQLYEAFLRDTLGLCPAETELLLSFTPAEARCYFGDLAPGAALFAQPDGDLGVRLRRSFDEAFRLGCDSAVVIGSDSPHLPAIVLHQAFDTVEEHGGCIGPSEDGGYYILGLSRPEPALFDAIAWSTAAVFEQTMERAEEAGVHLACLSPCFDIDTLEDLLRLDEMLPGLDEGLMYTRQALAQLTLPRMAPR